MGPSNHQPSCISENFKKIGLMVFFFLIFNYLFYLTAWRFFLTFGFRDVRDWLVAPYFGGGIPFSRQLNLEYKNNVETSDYLKSSAGMTHSAICDICISCIYIVSICLYTATRWHHAEVIYLHLLGLMILDDKSVT